MKKILIYLKFFWIAILLLIFSVFFWYYLPEDYSNFKGTLIASILGVGIAIFAAEGIKNLNNHRRIKKNFGFLRLIVIPFLKNQSQNFLDTANAYNDICNKEQAINFIVIIAQLNEMICSFDKSWLQLIFSQDFIDVIRSDEHFNRISHAILEFLLFINSTSTLSVNAKTLMMNRLDELDDRAAQMFITKAREFRNTLTKSAQDLQKYINLLDNEMDAFFKKNGVNYEEFER
ncbi:MAG: hypothetical protein WCV55_03805 [Candidatus Paceibacterota bacterium]